MCARAAAGGGGAVDWREERPGEGLTARAGKVEATATASRGRSKGDGDGEARGSATGTATGVPRSRRGRRDEDGGVAELTGTARQGRRQRGTGRRQREVGDEKLKIFEVFLI